MKVTKRQLKRIIAEEKQKLQEAETFRTQSELDNRDPALPLERIYNTVHDEVLDLVSEFLIAYVEEGMSPGLDNIRSLEKIVPEAANEALENALEAVGISRRQRDD